MGKPKIRFKGYTEDWEQRKLIDVCDYVDYRGKTPTKTDSGVFLVTAKNVKDGYIDYGVSQEYISEGDYEEVMRRGKPEIGDVLITTEAPSGNVAQVNRADIALAQRIIKYRGQSNIVDNTYLKCYLLSPEFQNILNAKSSGGTVKGIKGSILHQQEIKYPKYEEQFKIGSYFNNLDHLITLHHRKCEETKKLKKYMLQKMFPQNGQLVPKIRFAGFTEDWEQRKLGDVVEDYVEKTTIENQYPVLTSSQQMGIVLQDDYFSGDRVSQSGNIGYFVIPKGYFAYRSRSDNDVFVFNRNDCIDKGIISYFYPVFKPNGVNSDFLLRRLNYGLEPQLKIASEGTGQHVLSLKKFKNMETLFPEYEEQQRIGEYFAKLDTLITLHQRKCDELQNMKKYMLQNMFV